jgi:hypothetical protein
LAAALEAVKDCAAREGAEAILLGGAPFAGMAARLVYGWRCQFMMGSKRRSNEQSLRRP